MIRELHELVHFTKTSVWRDSALLAFFSKNDSALLHLYETLWKHDCATDEVAAKTTGISLTTYKKLSRRLQRHLLEMAVFFNEEKAKADASAKNQAEGILDAAILQLLFARGYRHAPKSLADRLLRRAKAYDLPTLAAEALRVLKSLETNPKQCAEYTRQYRIYRQFAETEERSAEAHRQIMLLLWPSPPDPADLAVQIDGLLTELRPWKNEIPSGRFHQYYFDLEGRYALGHNDYAAALQCYEEAIRWFQSRPYPTSVQLARFYSNSLVACILLGRYPEGETAALAALDHAEEGSILFFTIYELYFYLAMHTGHEQQALDIFQTATLHKRFAGLPELQRDTWRVLGAYLFLCRRMDEPESAPDGLPAFKSVRFPNETLVFSRDKRGMNLSILIAHLLLQLLELKETAVLERIQALDRYRQRYLRQGNTPRSELFIRILTILPKTGFSPRNFRRKAGPLLEQLKTLPRQLTNRTHELEVVPYEILIDKITDWLNRRPRT